MDQPRRIAVLGGSGGIGRVLVARLLAGGARVTVLDMPASLDRHPVPAGVAAIPVDLADDASVAAGFDRLEVECPALDGFVNLAGFMSPRQPLTEVPAAVIDEVWAANLRGAVLAATRVLPLLVAGQNASMVQVSSGLAQHVRPGFGPYAIAKAGLIALTKTLALEAAPRVRVNAVCPGAVDTAFLRGGTGRSDEGQSGGGAGPALDMAAYVAAIPLARLAQPEDVVGPILFLLSADSAYLTGQCLWINGGAYMP
jgi:NAD(P)-dependent dehydrogenase (short-subunit alcohol dehydrogenase family)